MKTIIITGGIGSGKSALCAHLAAKGIPVYDSDSRAKALYDENPVIVLEIEQALGENLRGADGFLDRKKVAGIIFADELKRQAMEDVLHPYVFEDFLRWRRQFVIGKVPYVVMESAIYLRTRYSSMVPGLVLLVDSPFDLRLKRACRRDSVSPGQILARMQSQTLDPSKADAVVVNDCDLQTFYERAEAQIERLINKQ